MKNTQKVDLAISHNQIYLGSRSIKEQDWHWQDYNIEQGAVIHKDFISFDPIIEGSFGAFVYIRLKDRFKLDPNALRCIRCPFDIFLRERTHIASVPSLDIKIKIPLLRKYYYVYYEACDGAVNEEIYFNLTFVVRHDVRDDASIYIIDDQWGGVANKQLINSNKPIK